MIRLLLRLLACVLVLSGGLLLARNAIARALVTGGVKAMTGLTLHMDTLQVGLLTSTVDVLGVALQNPPSFPEPIMVDLPELFIDYDLAGLFQGRVHLEEVRLNVKQLTVLRNADGALNLDALAVVQQSRRPPGEAKPVTRDLGAPALQIDVLQLQIGTVVFKDYSQGTPPKVREFPINLNERYQHITNPQVVAGLIVTKALANTAIAQLTHFDLQGLQASLSGALEKATGRVGDVAGHLQSSKDAVQSTITKVAETTRSAVQGAATAGQDAFGAVKGAVKRTGDTLRKVFPFDH